MDKRVQWLLEGEPWIEYRTRIDLLDQSENDPEVARARAEMISDSQVQAIISGFSRWQKEVVSNHKSAGLLIHKLVFLADIGVTVNDSGIMDMIRSILLQTDENNIIKVLVNIPVHFGGTGRNDWGWALCDSPNIYYALAKMGMSHDLALTGGISALKGLVKENGWPCTVSKELGKFRGPGKKGDFCPYATLIMLKALSQFDGLKDGSECRIAAEALLNLWKCSREQHPYMFYTGTDFRKLKAPFVWYDILHVADVLSRLDWLKDDEGLLDMAECIGRAAGENGLFTPGSEWKAWNGWEFSQKKVPSRWVTLLVLRILKRMGISYGI